MAAITAALIKQVREDTGAGMLDVKKALTEAEGDVARAKEIIRAKGIAAAGKREGRKAQEGTIASKVVETANGETGYAVELNSETDFVAKTPKFVEFTEEVLGYAVDADANSADELLEAKAGDTTVKLAVEEAAALFGEHISAMGAKWLTREDVPADVVESERRVATEKSLAEGKPEKIVPKIVEGRLNAFFKEVVLLEQPFVKDPSKTVGDLFKEVGGNATAFARVEVGKGEEE